MLTVIDLQGPPAAVGQAYGQCCREQIQRNLGVLIHRGGPAPLPRQDAAFRAWVEGQEDALARHWPSLLEEMHGVAAGCGAEYGDILLLNLRAWQYEYYGRPPAGGCSSVAVLLDDGMVACGGALDDPAELYCGPVRVSTTPGHSFVSFPIAGTSWGNRGMNAAGLVASISSQLLPGLERLPHALNQDLAMRVLLQTCTTVDDVREFCRAVPFTLNLVCVDAHGGLFCAHHTAAGLFELPTDEGWCALTNHVAATAVRQRLSDLGVTAFPESPTTRARRDKLVGFCQRRHRACTIADVHALIGRRDDADPGTIHNARTIALTCAVPQADARTLHVCQPVGSGPVAEAEFTAVVL